ncbi:MAG: helix-turn-helix domain-containing protein [Minisyncoccia bacterium]
MDLDLLLQFGLHKNDIKVYEALVSLGQTKSGELMTQAKVGSSRLYASLDALIAKGLVSYEVRNNVRYYKPEKIDGMIEQSKESTRALEALAEKIKSITPVVAERNETNVFEGYHGFKRAFHEHVDRMGKKEELRIIGFGARAPEKRALSKFLDEINEITESKKCKINILFDDEFKGKPGTANLGKDTDVRFLPSSYFGPTAYNISKTEVLLSVWGKDPLVIRIRNPILVASFTAHFDFLMSLSKKSE